MMTTFRCRCIYHIVTVSILVVTIQQTLSFVPLSFSTPNRMESLLSQQRVILRMKINDKSNNDDEDGKVIPSSKKLNETKLDQLSPMDIQVLQQQYEALITVDHAIRIENAVVGSNSSDRNASRESNHIKESSTLNNQEIFEIKCDIPSELISILKDQSLWTSNNNSTVRHIPTVLTSMERKRRLVEIELLQSLSNDDDESVHQLWSLWYTERGNHPNNHNNNATEELYAATSYSSDPNTWDKAEQILRQLILQHGIYWAEPVNRLATLYYLQGKYQQSIDLCRVVLHVKPWHFGALSGMVGLYIQMNDITLAKRWSEKRLPSYIPIGFIPGNKNSNSNQRRAEWVRNAVSEAKQSLRDAEHQLQSSFGKNDPIQRQQQQSQDDDRTDESIPPMDIDTDSWQ